MDEARNSEEAGGEIFQQDASGGLINPESREQKIVLYLVTNQRRNLEDGHEERDDDTADHHPEDSNDERFD